MRAPNPVRFFAALWRAFLVGVTSGRVFVSKGEKGRRVAICKACPYSDTLSGMRQCQICSCLVEAKASFRSEKCPKKLW